MGDEREMPHAVAHRGDKLSCLVICTVSLDIMIYFLEFPQCGA